MRALIIISILLIDVKLHASIDTESTTEVSTTNLVHVTSDATEESDIDEYDYATVPSDLSVTDESTVGGWSEVSTEDDIMDSSDLTDILQHISTTGISIFKNMIICF